MSRIGRWLREPLKVRNEEPDSAAFNRSFGRIVGGYDRHTDEAVSLPPDRSRGKVGDPTNTPRWVALLGVGAALGISGGVIALIIWLSA